MKGLPTSLSVKAILQTFKICFQNTLSIALTHTRPISYPHYRSLSSIEIVAYTHRDSTIQKNPD